MPILLVIGILLAVFVIFFLGPAIVATATVFARGTEVRLDAACASAQFAPYAERLKAARDRLQARRSVRVKIEAPDGVSLRADYFDLRAEKTVIFVHGYRAEPMLNFAAQADCFAERGWNLLLVTQRAHGDSGGKRSYLGIKEQYDLLGWVDWARLQPSVRKIAVYGISMGATTAAYAADKLDPDAVRALILDCGFPSPYRQIRYDCIKRRIPWRLLVPLIRLLAKLCYGIDIKTPITDALSVTTIPTFFLHGTDDKTVPYEDGRAIYEACAAPKRFFTAEGAPHVLAFVSDQSRAETELFSFLAASE